MSNVIEEYAKEYAQEENIKMAKTAATTMLKEGIPIEVIAKALPSLSLDLIKQLQQQIAQV